MKFSGNMMEESREIWFKKKVLTLSYANMDNTSQIESISTVKGSMSCLSQSFNLTNSMGPLCLTQEQQKSHYKHVVEMPMSTYVKNYLPFINNFSFIFYAFIFLFVL